MTRFTLCVLCALCAHLAAAVIAPNPYGHEIVHIADRAMDEVMMAAPCPVGTNRMARPVRVASQSVMGGQLVSRMTDGTTVVAPLKRATTARIPEAIARLRIERALARIAAASEADDAKASKRADALEMLATKAEQDKADKAKPKGKNKVALLGGVAAATGAAAYALRKQFPRRSTTA